jgi:hypothetical protein
MRQDVKRQRINERHDTPSAVQKINGRGLHSTTFSAQRKHFLWDALVGVSLTVIRAAQAELKSGRVLSP